LEIASPFLTFCLELHPWNFVDRFYNTRSTFMLFIDINIGMFFAPRAIGHDVRAHTFAHLAHNNRVFILIPE
jgi:hypothetical protein